MDVANRHRIYLAVPGVNFCWGTVTGVINSTRKHEAAPFNHGLGFSGVVDFNKCWVDALNMYEAGEVTHFAMLHGDLEPDPEQYWLDELLDIMDEKDAHLVSAHAPIKDERGVTSSGICDPTNPWGAFRRFTQRELLLEMPRVFDHQAAGYPDKPLLHNTGCWVCDLRKPIWHETNPDGTLRFLFEFPQRAIRGEDGRWMPEQESEDWLLSRYLWENGIRNTWITSQIRLTHIGQLKWRNWTTDWGTFKDGDENTAHRWRPERVALPLSLTQMLEFELGSECNLGKLHGECPNLHPERYGDLDTSRELDDHTIVRCAVQAYKALGFTGLIGWIYYNEPLLQQERMFDLMARIKAEAPQARFILWTNGTLIPEECEHFARFSQIVVSDYGEASQRGIRHLTAKGIQCVITAQGGLDDRLVQIEPLDRTQPCLRPFVELIIDNHGNTHLCCYDWQGKGTCGNVLTEDFTSIAERWREGLPAIAGQVMSDEAPQVCRDCGHRWSKYQHHDTRVIDRAREWRSSLPWPQPQEAGV